MLFFLYLPAALHLLGAFASERELSLEETARRYTKRTPGGLHVPIVSRETPSSVARRASFTATGLGDFVDVAYTVLMTIGGITTPLVLDTGSSDLWVMSDACTEGCSRKVGVYPQASFQYAGVDVDMLYGDSATGTFASGRVGDDTVSLAGLTLDSQYFGAINRTNTSVSDVGAAGIFGLGFPINSVIWNKAFVAKYQETPPNRRRREFDAEASESFVPRPNVKLGSPFPSTHLRRNKFPSMPGLLREPISRLTGRQASTVLAQAFASYKTLGPFIARLVALGELTEPMFSVTLQRDTIDVGGNVGVLSIGELPSGIVTTNLTWVNLRAYAYNEGGLPAPADSPNEVYPITWEVMLDAIYFDGQKLPPSTLSSSSIKLSALMDTGNSLLRGPADVVQNIMSRISGATTTGVFSCAEPHTISFQIGGKMFDVDPRDFVSQASVNNADGCIANLVATDVPSVGGYQFAWSLGMPFLKGVVTSYYYGNITYPSHSPPRMGFMSTVPSDAADQLRKAVAAATGAADKNFPAISETAPAGTIVPTNSNGVAQASHTLAARPTATSGALSTSLSISCHGSWSCIAIATSLAAGLLLGL